MWTTSFLKKHLRNCGRCRKLCRRNWLNFETKATGIRQQIRRHYASPFCSRLSPKMSNVAIIGAQWGDEGKGKIVDLFTHHADIVVRFQGGNNAGHTLVV